MNTRMLIAYAFECWRGSLRLHIRSIVVLSSLYLIVCFSATGTSCSSYATPTAIAAHYVIKMSPVVSFFAPCFLSRDLGQLSFDL